jgi:hypothetical protein
MAYVSIWSFYCGTKIGHNLAISFQLLVKFSQSRGLRFYSKKYMSLYISINTVFLSFLKRERERFPLFVPKRYCVTTRTFLDVLDCQRP